MKLPRMTMIEACILVVCVILLALMMVNAFAHSKKLRRGELQRADDSWIAGKKNAAGELCCGENDCVALNSRDVARRGVFYFLFRDNEYQPEVIHESEALPSPDGHYWRCHKPDGSRRCFFAPPLGS